MSRWMDKKNVDRYKQGIERYLEDIGKIIRLVKFQWGFEGVVDVEGEDYYYYTFEYQGEDQFSVKCKWTDFSVEDYVGPGFGPEHTDYCGFLTIREVE